MTAEIEEFPHELLLKIFGYFCSHCHLQDIRLGMNDPIDHIAVAEGYENQHQLRNLSLTCKNFLRVAIEVMYHAPTLRLPSLTPGQSVNQLLLKAKHVSQFQWQSQRYAEMVRKLVYPPDCIHGQFGIPSASFQLAMFPKLQHIQIMLWEFDTVQMPKHFEFKCLKFLSVARSDESLFDRTAMRSVMNLLKAAERPLDRLKLGYLRVNTPTMPCHNVTKLHMTNIRTKNLVLMNLLSSSFPKLHTLTWHNCKISDEQHDTALRVDNDIFEAATCLKDSLVHFEVVLRVRIDFDSVARWLPQLKLLKTFKLGPTWDQNEESESGSDGTDTEESENSKIIIKPPRNTESDTHKHVSDSLLNVRPKWVNILPASLVAFNFDTPIAEIPHYADFLEVAERTKEQYSRLKVVRFQPSLIFDYDDDDDSAFKEEEEIFNTFVKNGIIEMPLNPSMFPRLFVDEVKEFMMQIGFSTLD